MGREVTVTFTYEKEEYVQGVRYYLRKSHTISWIQVFFLLLALAGMALVIWMHLPTVPIFHLFVVVLIVSVGLFGLYLYLWKPGRLFGKSSYLKKPIEFTFSKNGIRRDTDQSSETLDWQLTDVWKSPQFYVLLRGRAGYLMIPRRAFRGEEEEQAFLEIVAGACVEG